MNKITHTHTKKRKKIAVKCNQPLLSVIFNNVTALAFNRACLLQSYREMVFLFIEPSNSIHLASKFYSYRHLSEP